MIKNTEEICSISETGENTLQKLRFPQAEIREQFFIYDHTILQDILTLVSPGKPFSCIIFTRLDNFTFQYPIRK